MGARTLSVVTRGLISPGTEEFGSSAQRVDAPPLAVFEGWESQLPPPNCRRSFYRFAWPRASFLTFGFFDPRGYSRGFSGLSALRFFRAVRFAFLRSSLLNFVVFAMNEYIRPLSLQIVFLALRPYNSKFSERREAVARAPALNVVAPEHQPVFIRLLHTRPLRHRELNVGPGRRIRPTFFDL